MMVMRFRYFIYIFLFLTLSCVKEHETLVPEGTVTFTIPYKAVVQGSELTRASISDSSFGEGVHYLFQTGDRLFIVDAATGGENLWGVLTLISGENTGSGIFEGTLNCTVSPTDETGLSATLVGPDQALYTISLSGDKITGPTYPPSIPYEAGGLADYVKKYSHFTSSSPFGARSFTLTQQTVFLNFSIENIAKSALNDSSEPITVSIKKGEPLETVRSFSGITLEGGNYFANAHFIGVLALTDDISSGQIFVENSTPISCGDPFSDLLTLEENKYYNVYRSCGGSWDGFTIQATASDTRITFKYANIQYSIDRGISWNDATVDSPIPSSEDPALSIGEEIWVRGKNTSYANTGGSTPLFTPTNLVNIYGDIMSLMCDENWVRGSAVGNQAFYQAFKGVAVNIPADKDLNLSAMTLGISCYEGMFNGCTSLIKAPVLPATTVAASSYKSMFEECTALTTPPSSLSATTLGAEAYSRMFASCSSLTYTPSFPGVKANLSGSQNFFQMFDECIALVTTSGKLFTDDTELTEECFHGMFRHCTKLANVPLDFLPSEHMAKWCYRGLFEGAAFITAPILPASKLVNECYRFMFNSCKKLKSITCLAENPNTGYTSNWVGGGVPSGGIFYRKEGITWPAAGVNSVPTGWTLENYTPPTP